MDNPTVNSTQRIHPGRMAILADVQSLFYAARNLHQSKIEYGRLLAGVTGNRQVTRSIAYVVQRDSSGTGFCEALFRYGYELRRKDLPPRNTLDIQSSWSWIAGICVDALALASRVDTILLASVDPQLTPLVEKLVASGCRVEIAGIERGISIEFLHAASAFIPIREDWMFKEAKFTSSGALPKVSPLYEGLPVDEELEIRG